jgi:hypothetical protein
MRSRTLELGREFSGKQAALIQITSRNQIVDPLVFGTVENSPHIDRTHGVFGPKGRFQLADKLPVSNVCDQLASSGRTGLTGQLLHEPSLE